MALSEGMQWALANGMTEDDVYNNINNWSSQFPGANAADRQAALNQYGLTAADVEAAQSRLAAPATTIDYFAQQFGEDTYTPVTTYAPTTTATGIATLTTTPAPTTTAPVVTSAPFVTTATVTLAPVVTSSFNYESVYDVFGGRDATNDLIAQFRAMGLDDNAIASVFAPYQKNPTTTAAPVVTSAPVTTLAPIVTSAPATTAPPITVTSTVTTAPVVTAISDADADRLVRAGYANIGRTGIGTGVNQIDQAGYNNFVNLLKSGAVKPADYASMFSDAATRYMADNPNDPYTQYVKGYLATNRPATTLAPTTTKAPTTTLAPVTTAAPVTTKFVDLPVVTSFASRGRGSTNVLNISGYGEVHDYDLDNWEPWRLQMWGIAKNADGVYQTSGPAWTTASGADATLFNQVNNISNLNGMTGAFTGGASERNKGGLGSKEAMIWDLTQQLRAQGVDSLGDLKERTVQVYRGGSDGSDGYYENATEFYNIKTGKTVNLQGTTVGNNETGYMLTTTGTGLVIPTTYEIKNGWAEFKESTLPIALTFLSIVYPPAAPYIQAYNAAKAAQDGRWMAAAFSGLSAASGFSSGITAEIDALANAGKWSEAEALFNNSWLAQNAGTIATAKDVVGVVNAATNNDVIGLINAGVKYAGATLPTELRTGVNLLNFGNALANKDTTGILNAAGDLTKSSDLKLAAAASNYINAINRFEATGDFSGIANATASFGNFIQNYSANSSTVSTTLAPSVTVAAVDDDVNNPVIGVDADGNSIRLNEINTLFAGNTDYASQASIILNSYDVAGLAAVAAPAAGATAATNSPLLRLVQAAANDPNYSSKLTALEGVLTRAGTSIARVLGTAVSLGTYTPGLNVDEDITLKRLRESGLITIDNFQPVTTLSPASATTKPPAPATTLSPVTTQYVVQPGDYTDTTEEVQNWQNTLDEVYYTDADGSPVTLRDYYRIIGFEPPGLPPGVLPTKPDTKPVTTQAPPATTQAPPATTLKPAPETTLSPVTTLKPFTIDDPTTWPDPLDVPGFDPLKPSTYPATTLKPATTLAPATTLSPSTTRPFKIEDPTTWPDPIDDPAFDPLKPSTYPATTLKPVTTLDPKTTLDPATTLKPVPATTLDPKTTLKPATTLEFEPATTLDPKTTLKPVPATTLDPKTTLKPVPATTLDPKTTLKFEPKTTLDPKTTLKFEPETTLDPKTTLKFEPETTLDPKTTLKFEPETTLDPKTTLKFEPETTLDPKTTLKFEPETTLDPKTTLKPEPETTLAPKTTLKPEPETTLAPKTTLKPEPETTLAPKTTLKPEPETTLDPKTTLKPEPETTLDPKTTLKPEPETTLAPKTTLKPEPETTLDPKTTLKPEPKTTLDPKTTLKPEPKTTLDPKTTLKPEPKTTLDPKTTLKPTTTAAPTTTVPTTTKPLITIAPVTTVPPTTVPPTTVPGTTVPPTTVPPTTIPPTTTVGPTTTIPPTTTAAPTTTKAVVVTLAPVTTKATGQDLGLNFPQVQQALAAAGIPQLANVFYYGKDFTSKKQKIGEKGELEQDEYKPLSVVKPGAEIEQLAEEAKSKQNTALDVADKLMGETTSFDDLIKILRG